MHFSKVKKNKSEKNFTGLCIEGSEIYQFEKEQMISINWITANISYKININQSNLTKKNHTNQ